MKYGAFFYGSAAFLVLLGCATWWLRRSGFGSTRAGSRCVNLALALLGVLLPLVAAEGFFLFFVDTTDNGLLTLTSRRWAERHVGHAKGANFRGRRGQDGGAVAGPRLSIAVLGDSVTFGQGVERDEDLYSSLLERGLRARGIAAEVRNYSRPGWNTTEELAELRWQFERGGFFHAVVLGFCLNDIGTFIRVPEVYLTATQRLRKPPALLDPLVDRSFVASFLYNRYATFRSPIVNRMWESAGQAYRSPEMFRSLAAQFQELKRLTDSQRAALVVVTFPSATLPWEEYPYRDVHRKLDAHWKGLGVTHVDLLPVFERHPPEDLRVGILDSHPNELGHRLAAEALIAAFLELRKPSRDGAARPHAEGSL